MTGIVKRKTKTANIYVLDHKAIKEYLVGVNEFDPEAET